MQNLFEKISYNNGHFPKKELEEIISEKETYIPELLSVAEDVRVNYKKYIEKNTGNYLGHIYAFYLLAQFRVMAFYPVFVDILKLPEDDLDVLLGDFLTEDSGRILASLYDKPDDITLLKELIEDENVYIYARGQAARALTMLALCESVKREDVLEYYKSLLKHAIDGADYHPYVITEIICCSEDLYPDALYDDIKQAYEQNIVLTDIIRLENIDRTMGQDRERFLDEQRKRSSNNLINNTIKEMQYAASFYKDREKDNKKRMKLKGHKVKFPSMNQPIVNDNKVRRNDPCPCGSGKKYKKCCGA